MGKCTQFVGKVLMEDCSADLTTNGKTIFIDLIDVRCEGVTGFRWFRVEFYMNTANNMNEVKCFFNFNCCLSVHVDNYTIIIPTKCTRFLLLKAQDIIICTFLSCIFAPKCFNPRGSSSGGSMPVPG
jgi:hypothetical protein